MFPIVKFGERITKEQELAHLDKIKKFSSFICDEIEYYKNNLKLIESSFFTPDKLDMLIVYLDTMKRNAYIIAGYNNLLNNYPDIIKPINWVVFHYFDEYSFNGSMFEMFERLSQPFPIYIEADNILQNTSLFVADVKKCKENNFASDKNKIYNLFSIDVERYLTLN